MDKSKKSHNLKLLAIAALLIITPLLSTSLRFKYLYFIVNILIIAVGADAGLISFFLQSAENKKPSASASFVIAHKHVTNSPKDHEPVQKPVKAVEKCSSEKNFASSEMQKIKKSPSSPSIFFIGGSEGTNQAEEVAPPAEDNEGEEGVDPSGQELYHKAETFIGNFYKQLKMQREESWKKLHDLPQKAF